MLPVAFLRQLIGFYGDQMQGLVPSYLEHSLALFAKEQAQFRGQMAKAMSGNVLGALQDQARRNMQVFQDAFKLFNPYAAIAQRAAETRESEDVDQLKQDLEAMRERLDKLGK